MNRNTFIGNGMLDPSVGDDFYGSLFRTNTPRSPNLVPNQQQQQQPAVSYNFGGGNTPSVPASAHADKAKDALADFDSWWQPEGSTSQTPSPATPPAANAATVPSVTPPDAQPVKQQGAPSAQSPADHPAVGDFKFTPINADSYAKHIQDTYLSKDAFELTADELQKVAAGDLSPYATKLQNLRGVVSSLVARSVQDAMVIIEDQMKGRLSDAFNAYGKHSVRTEAMKQAGDVGDRGALKFVASQAAEQYLKTKPNATAAEVRQAVEKFMNGLKAAYSQQPAAPSPNQTDWTSF